jgi:hypothetical protein
MTLLLVTPRGTQPGSEDRFPCVRSGLLCCEGQPDVANTNVIANCHKELRAASELLLTLLGRLVQQPHLRQEVLAGGVERRQLVAAPLEDPLGQLC